MIKHKPPQTYRKPRLLGVCLLGISVCSLIVGYRFLLVSPAPSLPINDVHDEQAWLPMPLGQVDEAAIVHPSATPQTEPLVRDITPAAMPDEFQVKDQAMPRIDLPRDEASSMLSVVDGLVPDGTTVFDDLPGITKLEPALLEALRQAAIDAADHGISFYVTSGWRSPTYQNLLFREAVISYGSEAEAARWVATAETSPHVSGAAIDLGGDDAITWLAEHGASYGLCQIYLNEPWHYELRPEALVQGCPPMYADPTHDPRMQQ